MNRSLKENSLAYPNVYQGFGIVLIFILLSFLTGIFISAGNFHGHKGMLDFLQLLGYMLAAGGTFLIIARIKVRQYDDKPVLRNYRVTPADFIIVLLVTFMVIIVLDPLTNLIPVPDTFRELFESMFSKTLPAFITAVIVAPILEELIFRGIVLEGFLRNYCPVKAIIWTNVLFGFAHLNPWQFIGAFFMGIFISWVYYKTRNLNLAIFIHMINNLLSYLFLYFTDKPVTEATLNDVFTGSSGYLTLVILCLILLGLFFAFSNRIFPIKPIKEKYTDHC